MTDPNTITPIMACDTEQPPTPLPHEYYTTRLQQYIQDKLWHQCTIVLLQYLTCIITESESSSSLTTTTTTTTATQLHELYTTVLTPMIQSKIHPLAYARMIVLIASASSSSSSSTMTSELLLTDAYRLLKEQQQQALALLHGTSSSGGGSGGSHSRRDNSSTSNSSSNNNTSSIDYGTPTSYVEALLYIQCHQAMETMRSYSSSSSVSSTASSSVDTKQFLQTNIYHKVIQPNATVIQDLISMTTTGTTTRPALAVITTKDDGLPPAASLYDSTMVYSAYYEMTMMYDHIVTPFTAQFFHHAIQYLQYYSGHQSTSSSSTTTTTTTRHPVTKATTISDPVVFATHLCWSAILGEGIYNLSYMMEHPLIVAVRNSSSSSSASSLATSSDTDRPTETAKEDTSSSFHFVDQLLSAMESCHYESYQQLLATATTANATSSSSSHLLLVPSTTFGTDHVIHMIREKFTLITLLHVITTTSSSSNNNNTTAMDEDDMEEHKENTSATSDRTFTFDDLTVALHLNDTDTDATMTGGGDSSNRSYMLDLEMILMRAISIGLIKGTIDEILQIVTITYIQPLTTLTQSQLTQLLQQYNQWTTNIQYHITNLQKEAIATK